MNNNLDETTMKNIKNMIDSGNINGAISQISPEMIQNVSKMFAQSQNNNSQNGSSQNNTTQNSNSQNMNSKNINQFASSNYNQSSSSNEQNSNASASNNFDFSNIDINSIMKIAGNMNMKNDPRNNLLNSLKPYLRDNKKEKLDNYINLLNMSKIAETLKNSQNNNKDIN